MSKIKFNSLTAIQAGQKSNTVNAEPRLIANSTLGKFIITAPVSKALGIAVGENVQFLNNIPQVESEIAKRNSQLVEWCTEQGLDIESKEGQKAILREFATWYIAKGIPQFTPKGEPVMANVRYTREEKLAGAAANVEAMLENEDIRAAIAEVMQNENFTTEELLDVLGTEEETDFVKEVKDKVISFVETPKYHSCTGSKTATTGSATGVGCQLNFTDTAVWTSLKSDIEDKESKNRNFKVNLEEPETAIIPNGYENVTVTAFPLEFLNDTDPIVRGRE